MGTVELLLPPDPVHVRTARLVSVAAGRRAGLKDDQIDELRLAVGEACARAVALNAVHAAASPVRLLLQDDQHGDGRLVVEVHDAGPAAGPGLAHQEVREGLDDGDQLDPEISLAVLRGLVDEVSVDRVDDRTVVVLTWRA